MCVFVTLHGSVLRYPSGRDRVSVSDFFFSHFHSLMFIYPSCRPVAPTYVHDPWDARATGAFFKRNAVENVYPTPLTSETPRPLWVFWFLVIGGTVIFDLT